MRLRPQTTNWITLSRSRSAAIRANLITWLQPWEEARRKDRVEVKLHCLVCSGQVALADAQHQIVDDWQAAYHRYARVKCAVVLCQRS